MIAASPIVLQIAHQFARTQHAVVSFRYHRVFDVSAGPSSRHDDMIFDGIDVDGTLVKVRVLRDFVGGKPASASDVASVVRSYEHPKAGAAFDAPWDLRFASDYRYAVNGRRVVFTAAMPRAAGFGNGSFTFDGRGNVVAYSYSPDIMPQYARSGTIAGSRSAVLPGYWATTRETQSYTGSYLLVPARATVKISESNFRRFSTLSAAASAVAADTL
jgi:hypothetical protein